MRNEQHRRVAVEAFQRYWGGEMLRLGRVRTIALASLRSDELIEASRWLRCVYVLRLSDNVSVIDPSVASIPANGDSLQILYIGGHDQDPSDKPKERFNKLLKESKAAQRIYDSKRYAENDKRWGHPVAAMLTTSLLSTGFRVDKHCVIDLIDGGADELDELELIIGYQERFHQLPPWNAIRKGRDVYAVTSGT